MTPIAAKQNPVWLSVLGPLLKRGRAGLVVPPAASLKHVLVIKPEKLGDMVTTLPLIDALRAAAPEVVIDLIASPKGVAVVQEDPRFNRIDLYTKNAARDLAMIRSVRRRQYDVTIEMIDDDSTTGLLLSQVCSGNAVRLGANKSRFAGYYDVSTDYHANPHVHAIDRALDLAPVLGLPRTGLSGFAEPYLPLEAKSKAERFLKERLPGAGPLVAVNVSAGKATRLWADEKYASLMAGIARFIPEATLVLISDPADRARGERIIARTEARICHIPESWSILDVAALLAQSTIVVSPDTSVVHLARAFQVPVVGLYPRPQWMVDRWKPYGQTIGVVRSDDDGDIADISPEAVMAAFRDLTRQEKVIDR